MFKKKFLYALICTLIFSVGLAIPSITQTAKAINDQSTCTVQHSGSGNLCVNTTYAYEFEGGGEFVNSHKHYYTGYSNSIKLEKQIWDPISVTKGEPYYQYAWVDGPDTTTTYYGRDLSQKRLSQISSVSFTMNKTVNLKGQSTLRINSNFNSAWSGQSVNYDAITYPR